MSRLGSITWSPGIGDPTWIGWLTTTAYFGAACLCADSFRRSRWAGWLVLAAGLVLLGFNKQLDLQTLVIQTGRRIALDEGWYGQRRQVQAGFAVLVAALSTVCLAGIFRVARRQPSEIRVSLIGAVLLVAFVATRAAAFQHLRALNFGADFNAWFELAGITLVAAGAWQSRQRHSEAIS